MEPCVSRTLGILAVGDVMPGDSVTAMCCIMVSFSLSNSDSKCDMILQSDLEGSDDNET